METRSPDHSGRRSPPLLLIARRTLGGLVIDLDQPRAEKVWPMEKFIAQRNIAHFEELLSNETNPAEIRILKSMLHEERTKLATLEGHSSVAEGFRSDADSGRVTH
jgi:hypothetical protein